MTTLSDRCLAVNNSDYINRFSCIRFTLDSLKIPKFWSCFDHTLNTHLMRTGVPKVATFRNLLKRIIDAPYYVKHRTNYFRETSLESSVSFRNKMSGPTMKCSGKHRVSQALILWQRAQNWSKTDVLKQWAAFMLWTMLQTCFCLLWPKILTMRRASKEREWFDFWFWVEQPFT